MIEGMRKLSIKGSLGRKIVNLIFAIVCAYLVYLGVNSFQQGEKITETGDRVTRIERSDCKQARLDGPRSRAASVCSRNLVQGFRNLTPTQACVLGRKILTSEGIQDVSRCETNLAKSSAGTAVTVDQEQRSPGRDLSPDTDNDSGGGGGPDPPTDPNRPDSREPSNDPDSPDDSSPSPEPPVDPPTSEPSSPQARPSLELSAPGIGVEVGPAGACVSAAQLNVNLGSC